MSWFLLGLQWAGIAFGIFVMALVGAVIAYSAVKLIYGQFGSREEYGAPEGDARNFRLRSIDDDHLWEDA